MFEKKKTEPVKSNISALAHISTLSDEEKAKAEEESLQTEIEDVNGDGRIDAKDYLPGGEVPASAGGKAKRMNHSEPSIVVSARPDQKTMYDFMLYHSYANVLGVLSILIGIGAIVMVIMSITTKADKFQTILFAVVAIMFLSNSPLTLWFRAKKQSAIISDEKNVIMYTFSDEGFDMSRGENEYADFGWDHVYKVKEGKLGFYIYLERNRAFVVPKENIEEGTEAFEELLKRHVTKRLLLASEK